MFKRTDFTLNQSDTQTHRRKNEIRHGVSTNVVSGKKSISSQFFIFVVCFRSVGVHATLLF